MADALAGPSTAPTPAATKATAYNAQIGGRGRNGEEDETQAAGGQQQLSGNEQPASIHGVRNGAAAE